VTVLEFDSEWFGKRIGRHDAHPEEADLWAKSARLDCVFTLLPIEEIGWVHWAANNGFRLTDVKVEFSVRTSLREMLAEAGENDWVDIQEIARTAFRRTRFHNDRHFDPERVNEMYANWALTSPGATFVAKAEKAVAGFVTVGATHLELIAVDSDHRGEGHGLELAQTAIGYAYERGLPTLRVVTQGGNHAAQRTFQAAGFELVGTALWLHKWYE
jgi:ribosomal protein S18 acetylase RimI-like enzyme